MSNGHHLFSKTSFRERLAHINAHILQTSDVRKVSSLCDRLWRQAGIKGEGDGGLVMGNTGAGKTTAVKAWADAKFQELKRKNPEAHWERPEVSGTDILPIWEKVSATGYKRHLVVVSVDPRPRFNALLRNVAQAMGVLLPKRFDFGQAMVVIKKQIVEQQIKMIVFDDIQHIVEADINSYEAADVLKIFNKSRVQIVGVGLPTSIGMGTINPQLKRLIKKQHTIGPMKCSLADFPEMDANGRVIGPEIADKGTFCKFVKFLDENSILPFDSTSNLSEPQMALRLFKACDGYVGVLMGLLFQATDLALEKGLSKLGPKVLAAAYQDATNCDDAANWFLMDFVKVKETFGAPKHSKRVPIIKATENIDKAAKKQQKRIENVLAGRI